jgi:hypothetical protein
MAKYIKNPGGQVHSITDEHYESLLEGDGDTEQRYLPHGYSDVTEAQARKAHPQLFGEPDPAVEAARVHLADPNQGTSAADAEARVNALVEQRVAEAVAAAIAAQQK